MLRRTHSPTLLSNLTKEDDRRTSQRANPIAKEVTLGAEPAIWNHQETHLPSRAERPHDFHPVGSDNCSEPIFWMFPLFLLNMEVLLSYWCSTMFIMYGDRQEDTLLFIL